MSKEILLKQYEAYPNSDVFITACYEVLLEKPDTVRYFINNLANKNLSDFHLPTLFKVDTHLKNIANTKLQMGDYRNYRYLYQTLIRLRIVAAYIQNNNPGLYEVQQPIKKDKLML